METIIFYILIFCIGTVFGSFISLAVYRIPLHEDITHKHSYCPKCNHKLVFLDMIPILSYIFLGGKCRYCKLKIRPRYLILELLTGLIFLLLAMSVNINILNIQIDKISYLIMALFYIVGLIILAGIDKEKHTISNPILLYEIIIISIYMIYLYIVEKTNIHRYVIYLLIMLGLLAINTIYYKKKLKDYYPIDIFILSIIMASFTYEWCFLYTVILTLISMAVYLIILKIINKKFKYIKAENKKENIEIPIAFFMCCSNIILVILVNWIAIVVGG